jgi:uncharacterized LabA/DUF88 family protein
MQEHAMIPHVIAFVDAGFLRAAGERLFGLPPGTARIDVPKTVEWIGGVVDSLPELDGQRLLRVYWYDGAFDPSHPKYLRQRAFHTAVAQTPGVRLRLGHLQAQSETWRPAVRAAAAKAGLSPERFDRDVGVRPVYEQKGVDTLLVLDLVILAQVNAYETAILVTGDRDIAEAVRRAQDLGRRLVLVCPTKAGVAAELRQLADRVVDVDAHDLDAVVTRRVHAS